MRPSMHLLLPAGLAYVIALAAPASLHAQLGGFGGEMGGMGGSVVQRSVTQYDPLVKVISTTVAPQSWDQVGGPASIQILEHLNLLVVSQTSQAHEEIEDLLEVIRKARRMQAGEEISSEENQPSAERHPVSLPIGGALDAKAQARIRSALGNEVTLDYVEVPLREAVASLQESHRLPIVLDTHALEDAGIDADAPVTASLRGISLRSALRLILRELDLTYTIQNEVLTITTPEEAEARLVTRVYPVRDLGTAGNAREEYGSARGEQSAAPTLEKHGLPGETGAEQAGSLAVPDQ